MEGYYEEKLSGEALRHCYEVAPPRVRQYLEAEIQFALSRLRHTDVVLELGCGYGRVAVRLAEIAERVVGIDTSCDSLDLARQLAGRSSACKFMEMNAVDLAFPAGEFDAVVCVQNAICAFGVDQARLIREVLRVTRPGGRLLFSSYSEEFWPHRLSWFEAQAKAGLVGEIDYTATGDGVIVCVDGFRVGLMTPEVLRSLCDSLGLACEITVVGGSSVFCEVIVPGTV